MIYEFTNWSMYFCLSSFINLFVPISFLRMSMRLMHVLEIYLKIVIIYVFRNISHVLLFVAKKANIHNLVMGSLIITRLFLHTNILFCLVFRYFGDCITRITLSTLVE